MKRIGTVSVLCLAILVITTISLLYNKQINPLKLQSSEVMKSSELAPEEDTQVIMGHMTNQTERLIKRLL